MELDYEETFVTKPILFGDYMKMGLTGDERMYEYADIEKLPKLYANYLDEYNQMSTGEARRMPTRLLKD